MRGQDQLSRLLDEFCALVFDILHPPPPLPVPFPEEASPLGRAVASGPPMLAVGRRPPQVSAAGFASLLLGVSLALMLCGSVTFMIGFILMPWVLGLVVVLHFLGILSNLSALGRSIISPAPPSPKSPQKMSGTRFEILEMTMDGGAGVVVGAAGLGRVGGGFPGSVLQQASFSPNFQSCSYRMCHASSTPIAVAELAGPKYILRFHGTIMKPGRHEPSAFLDTNLPILKPHNPISTILLAILTS
ncbi:hypothetical protein Taro_013962 [Colocasia esculenta]|uniref:Uncharacterized protein n=1 Tax=Colocasia esculenta TaxID=4460 RepID=A0A843UHY9_COLES|nr:hypothetical protein [Colocasia esculenta]